MRKKIKKISIISSIVILLILGALFLIMKETNKNKNESTNTLQQTESKEDLNGSGIYSIDLDLSKIGWEGKKTFIKDWIDTGSISIQSGNFILDKNKITEGEIIVDMNSINVNNTGSGKGEDILSKHLKSVDFFDTETFPISKFSLISLFPDKENYQYNASGDITIKNITKTIEFPVSIYMQGETIIIESKIILDRSQFNVKFGSSNFFENLGDKAIDNNFILKLRLIAKKQ